MGIEKLSDQKLVDLCKWNYDAVNAKGKGLGLGARMKLWTECKTHNAMAAIKLFFHDVGLKGPDRIDNQTKLQNIIAGRMASQLTTKGDLSTPIQKFLKKLADFDPQKVISKKLTENVSNYNQYHDISATQCIQTIMAEQLINASPSSIRELISSKDEIINLIPKTYLSDHVVVDLVVINLKIEAARITQDFTKSIKNTIVDSLVSKKFSYKPLSPYLSQIFNTLLVRNPEVARAIRREAREKIAKIERTGQKSKMEMPRVAGEINQLNIQANACITNILDQKLFLLAPKAIKDLANLDPKKLVNLIPSDMRKDARLEKIIKNKLPNALRDAAELKLEVLEALGPVQRDEKGLITKPYLDQLRPKLQKLREGCEPDEIKQSNAILMQQLAFGSEWDKDEKAIQLPYAEFFDSIRNAYKDPTLDFHTQQWTSQEKALHEEFLGVYIPGGDVQELCLLKKEATTQVTEAEKLEAVAIETPTAESQRAAQEARTNANEKLLQLNSFIEKAKAAGVDIAKTGYSKESTLLDTLKGWFS